MAKRAPTLRADQAVARILAESERVEELYPQVLAAIGESLGWELGAIWELPDGADALSCLEVWCSADAWEGAQEFARVTREAGLVAGEGLPGRVLASGEPAWIVEFSTHDDFPRARRAALAGVHSAACFPIRSASRIIGAVEFFTSERREPDPELLETMATLGSQIGQLVERRRAEALALDAANHQRATVDAALDCIITIDDQGRVLAFNPAAEQTFGYTAEEALGREMAELIVPPSLRERHREGFARCVKVGGGALLGTRVEITGMRADGGEFPVELTITQVGVPGPPRFTGFVRDITERKLAETELRASRRRIVEEADAARRRIERDLHDGAQQWLVNLGLTLRMARARLGEDADHAGTLLDEAMEDLEHATSELRELARGIHPAVLTDGGLGPALRALVRASKVPVQVEAVPHERFEQQVEAAAYFVVAEALTNVARDSGAASATVALSRDVGRLVVEVRDDGRGGADPERGSGLRGLADRMAAMDGALELMSPPGEGTLVRAIIPCA
jgi:PAS domain S-box-containing protein